MTAKNSAAIKVLLTGFCVFSSVIQALPSTDLLKRIANSGAQHSVVSQAKNSSLLQMVSRGHGVRAVGTASLRPTAIAAVRG